MKLKTSDPISRNSDVSELIQQNKPLIVQIAAYYPPALGGVEKVIETTALNLVKSGWEVLVITSGCQKYTRITKSAQLTIKRLFSFEVARIPIAPTLLWHLWCLPKMSLVHFHLVQAYWPERVFLICKLRRIPYIVHFHLDIAPSGPLGLFFVLYKKIIWGFFLRNAQEVIVCSEEQRPIVVEKYRVNPDRVTVILNAVGSDYFSTIERKKVDTVIRLLYVGRLAAQKKIERLIHMMSFIKTPCELTIIGDGECRFDLEKLVESKNLKNVTFLGAKNSFEIKKYFADNDMLLISSDREGLSLVMLEAMAAGLPIIGTNVAGISELLDGVGVLVNEPYPENFAKEVIFLIGDTERLKQLSQKSIAKARLYSWEVYNDRLDKVYQKVQKIWLKA